MKTKRRDLTEDLLELAVKTLESSVANLKVVQVHGISTKETIEAVVKTIEKTVSTIEQLKGK